MINVFVYGTLKPDQVNHHLIESKLINITQGFTYGELYHLPLGYPAMIKGNSQIKGFLLSFEDDQVLETLDQLEDDFYDRLLIPVYSAREEKLSDAWAYITTPEQIKLLAGILVPSGWWQPNITQI
jgi:gamma-glutamylcyclotransferase (GGCT)/AIG2-like uncharacterized protein YtfP